MTYKYVAKFMKNHDIHNVCQEFFKIDKKLLLKNGSIISVCHYYLSKMCIVYL